MLASCTSNIYKITTHSERESGYRILSVRDSSLVVFPLRYSEEVTPKLIGQYARAIPFDSLTELRREASSGVGEILLGMLGGSLVGASIGAVTYTHSGNEFGTFLNAVTSISSGGLIGLIVGGIIGYFLHPGEKDMLPPSQHLKDLRDAEYYRWGEPPEIEKIK
jgi:hypothetical protein